MKLSTLTPTLLFYRAYVEGGDAGGISPLAWLLAEGSGLPAHVLENALMLSNPLVVLRDQDDPLAVGLVDEAEEELFAFCREVEALNEVLV